jgi:hypothetical protein
MQKMLFSATALLLMSAGYVSAAITGQDIVNQYQSSGYQSIEVKVGPTQAKVEAIKDGVKVETVYDLATGNVLKSENEAVDPNKPVSSKVELETTDKDFTGDDDGKKDSADDQDDDDNSGSGSGDDDGSDSDDDGGNSGSGGGDNDGGKGGGEGSSDD